MRKQIFLRAFIIIITSVCLAGISLSSYCNAEEDKNCYQQSEQTVKSATFGHIDARGLKALIDAKIPFILLDARGNSKWDDGRRIPGAKSASPEFSLVDFETLIPNNNALIVVYCGAYQCPLGKRLAKKLSENSKKGGYGYPNVLEYSGGIKEWSEIAQYPIENVLKSK